MGAPYRGDGCTCRRLRCRRSNSPRNAVPRTRSAHAKELRRRKPGYGTAMLTSAIIFGMVGVAAGFTWDYVINRGK
jgi:hypothetical protein